MSSLETCGFVERKYTVKQVDYEYIKSSHSCHDLFILFGQMDLKFFFLFDF